MPIPIETAPIVAVTRLIEYPNGYMKAQSQDTTIRIGTIATRP